jgi:hypothetical protein
VLTHRYVGLVMAPLMLAWCLSGFVMLFVQWPEVSEAERAAGLAPIDWSRCCDFGRELPDALPVESAAIEGVAGRPVLRLTLPDGSQGALDLGDGEGIRIFGPDVAALVASTHTGGEKVVNMVAVERDQWTVTGYYNDQRPFWRVRMGDGRHVYVSLASGEVAQATTSGERLWNWFGAIPHWLYPAILRQDVKLWTQVVIWTSLVGTFLTLAGLWLGIVAWRPWGDRRLSPYKGLMTWHHLTGLAAGILTLTWVVSGLLSMNPWGLLESGGDPAGQRLRGAAPTWGQVRPALTAAAAGKPKVKQLRLVPFQGRVYVMADRARLDAAGRPAPLSAAELARAGASLGPIESQGLIAQGDAYHFSHHERAVLPAWRVVRADGVRHYLDPASGEVLETVDAPGRTYRWLHLGLHRFDFLPGAGGAGWALAVALLLAAATATVFTGAWLAWRRLKHDLAAPFRKRRRERPAP